MTTTELACLDHAGFIAAFKDVYEHSAWIAEAAWASAPFSSWDALNEAMAAALDAAGEAPALALVRAHPDLAGHAALKGELTADSTTEQAVSGLAGLDANERARFQALNDAYRAKFGFPFVMAVRKSTKTAILTSFAARLENDPSAELQGAIREIKTIARLRLDAIAG